MSLMSRRRPATGETPEQTLARLNAVSSAGKGGAPGSPCGSRFTKARKKGQGYDVAEVDRVLDEQISELDAAAAPVGRVSGRLARIPQRRWRGICIAFWLALPLLVLLGTVLVDKFAPSSSTASWAVWLGALFAPLAFWYVGVSRTEQMDRSEWTLWQRVSKNLWDDMDYIQGV